MKTNRLCSALLLLLLATPLLAAKQWYDAYLDGVDAAKKKNWTAVVQRMNEAIALKPNEEARARTYGTQFLKYRPYYYRGIANFQLGKFEEALRDLNWTGGVGDVDLGSPESMANKAQAELRTPEPPPTETRGPTTNTRGEEPRPLPPPVDTAARERARADRALSDANARAREAAAQQASSYAPLDWQQAQSLLEQATRAAAAAESASDWTNVASLADRAARTFNTARTVAAGKRVTPPNPINPIADEVLAANALRPKLKNALELYFGGRFDDSARLFEELTRTPAGSQYPLMWAFLGAAHYYTYYLEGEGNPDAKRKAREAFLQARKLRPALKLPSKYFSPRVQNYYNSLGR